MAPKGGNAKKESGRAKKAENEARKKDTAELEKERKEADKWNDGAKTSKAKEDKEERRKAELARKAERERLLAEEEAAIATKPKPAPKAGTKKKQEREKESRPAGPGALAAGGGLAGVSTAEGLGADEDPKGKTKEVVDERRDEPESFAATGIDDALDLLDVVNAKTDKASVGQQAAGIERHPERRFKAAFETYQENALPSLRKEHPGLRLQQYKDLMYKQFQKSPENPFNQTVVSFNASKEDKVEALERRNKEVEDRLKEKTKALTLDGQD